MRMPAPKESEDQITFVKIVREYINPGWRFTHIPNGELRNIKVAMKLKHMGVSPGVPDFLFFGPDRFVFALELKRRGGGVVLTLEQLNWRDHLRDACGFAYLATNDIDDALGELYAHGIIKARGSA